MSHCWTTGSSEQALAAAGLELRFNYFIDDSKEPLSFDPAKAAGQFFGAVNYNGTWTDGTVAATPGNLSLFAAGDKFGKNAVTQGWWNQIKIPFKQRVNITVSVVARDEAHPPGPRACAAFYAVVRGYEVSTSAPLILPSGFSVPAGARLELHTTDMIAAPNAWVPLMNLSKGHEGLILGLGLGLETSPPWGTQVDGKLQVRNNYVEGCWNLLRSSDEELPGMVLGTGLEDFWDSGYGFSLIDPGISPLPASSDSDGEIRLCKKLNGTDSVCPVTGAPFQHSSAGVVHFSADYTTTPKGVERFSGYRFFDGEVVGVDDGGWLGWTNGCAGWNKPGTNKCGVLPATQHRGHELGGCQTWPTHVRSYVWVYTWKKQM